MTHEVLTLVRMIPNVSLRTKNRKSMINRKVVNLKSPLTKLLRMVSLNSVEWTMVSTMCMSKSPRLISTKSSSPTNVFMRRLTCLSNNSPHP